MRKLQGADARLTVALGTAVALGKRGFFSPGADGVGGARLQLPRPLDGKGDQAAQDIGVGSSLGRPRFIILLAVDGFLKQFVSATCSLVTALSRASWAAI